MMQKEGATKKHISSACLFCRYRKVKCDGKTPTCSNCTLYNHTCEYSGNDKRKLSHKRTIQSLNNRVAFLENLLRSHGIEVPLDNTVEAANLIAPPPSNEKRRSQDDGVMNHAPLPNFNEHTFMAELNPELTNAIQFEKSMEGLFGMNEIGDFHTEYTDAPNIFQSPQNSRHSFYGFNQAVNRIHGNGQQLATGEYDDILGGTDISASQGAPISMSQSMLQPTNDLQLGNTTANGQSDSSQAILLSPSQSYAGDHDEQSDDDEVVNQLSARIGTFQIAEDGQLRYYGATSNLHILQNGVSSLPRALRRSIRLEGEEALARAELNQRIDPELEKHLEDLYFRWEDPAIHVVDEEMYFLAKNAYYLGEDGSPFYSETLKNTICAAGSHMSSDDRLPDAGAEFFNSRAKLLLQIEMDSPSIATVQALVIMSATEAACTRDSRGWLYSGMAVRLSADLGLHRDPSCVVQNGSLSERELDVRRTTFWGVFVHDSMWSLYVGRPSSINVQDISISRPSQEHDKLRSKKWSPLRDSNEGKPGTDQELEGWFDPIEACADANVSLCYMMRQLSQTVYSERTFSDEGIRELAASMRVEFTTWQNALPEELRVDISDENRFYLPHVLQLHMQFYTISILLHRPFFSRTLKEPNFSGSNHPRNICINAAQSIVKLLRIYRKQHTLRRPNVHIVHLIFTASLICIYNAYSSRGAAVTKCMNDLQFCCQALGEMGEAWGNATRALEVIICIKRDWFSKIRNFPQIKRRSPTGDDRGLDEDRRKRRLTQGQEEV
ncbi:hypothetical protein V491_08223 [Pseudogymnoascus sp. VKM F-3775]|nr:hypothetical protein V491_08223 [Pseudogymnoascus sp. VKM F-3775]